MSSSPKIAVIYYSATARAAAAYQGKRVAVVSAALKAGVPA